MNRGRIRDPEALAEALASRVRAVRELFLSRLSAPSGEESALRRLDAACRAHFRDAPPHADFADAFAQTVAYGLLSARWISRELFRPGEGRFDRRSARAELSIACPFLGMLFDTALGAPGASIPIDEGEPELLERIDDLAALLDQTDIASVFRSKEEDGGAAADPVIHFYALFLGAYDATTRRARGVYATPRPVAASIVRSVDEALAAGLGLPDGLADTTTWGQLTARHRGLSIPAGAAEDTPFVQILDPATGTGTFLVLVIEAIHATLAAKWRAAGADSAGVRRLFRQYASEHLLGRLHGFEVMMAPYAIAHLTVGLLLRELGAPLSPGQRLGIHFRSALLPSARPEPVPITVVVGNPPYRKLSQNLTPEARALVEAYRYIDGQRITERGALQFEINLQDDYVKFTRKAQMLIEEAGVGVLGVITNSGYLSTPTLQGMRRSLLLSFDRMSILNLHGQPARGALPGDGDGDENVFDIQQGVAILVAQKTLGGAEREVWYGELRGPRRAKYARLEASPSARLTATKLTPAPPHYKLEPTPALLREEFDRGTGLGAIFPLSSAGVVTARDALVVGFTAEEVLEKVDGFRRFPGSDEEACRAYGVSRSKRFDPVRARRELRAIEDLSAHVVPITYRPFDVRYLFYHKAVVWSRAFPVSSQMIGRQNLMLVATRQSTLPAFEHAFVSRHPIEIKLCSHDRNCQGFPVQTFSPEEKAEETACSNVATAFQEALGVGSALGVAAYVYALLYSSAYRGRFLPFLRSEFPKIPMTRDKALRERLLRLGGQLIAVHLLEAAPAARVALQGSSAGRRCAAPRFELPREGSQDSGRIVLGEGLTIEGVAAPVFGYRIGGYQVCQKWLKDRRGRALGEGELTRYLAIVSALSETIRLTAEIDAAIAQHGGFPGAFQGA